MPRHPKGSGKRPQTGERANTATRKIAWATQRLSQLEKEELIGIAQGILCDKSVNYIEYPYLEAVKGITGNPSKISRSEAKARHRYKPTAVTDKLDKKTYRAPHTQEKRMTFLASKRTQGNE